mgnify:CR=1 FL=1
MRIRTVWNWRLRLYPLLVAVLYLYVAAQASQPSDQGRSDGEAVKRQAATTPASAAPLHGFHQGRAITCFTHPKVTLCYSLTGERR